MLRKIVKFTLMSLMLGSGVAQACETEIQAMNERMMTKGTDVFSESFFQTLSTAMTYLQTASELCKNGDVAGADDMLSKTDIELNKIDK